MLMLGRTTGSSGAGTRCSVGPPIGPASTTAMIMPAVPVMHEHVHERACRQEQPRQPGQDVRPVLGKEEKSADEGKGEEH